MVTRKRAVVVSVGIGLFAVSAHGVGSAHISWAAQHVALSECTAGRAIYQSTNDEEPQRTVLRIVPLEDQYLPQIRVTRYGQGGREEWSVVLEYTTTNSAALPVTWPEKWQDEASSNVEILFVDGDGAGTFVSDGESAAPWLIILTGMGSASQVSDTLAQAAGAEGMVYLGDGPYRFASCRE